MGSTSYLGKSKTNKSGSSAGSDKDMNGKLRRTKIRRPAKMNEYGMKRIPDYTELAYKEAVGKLRYFLSGNYSPSVRSYGGGSVSIKNLDEPEETSKKYIPYSVAEYTRPKFTSKYAALYADSLRSSGNPPPATPAQDTTAGTNPDVVHFIQKQEEYIEQLERESQYCRDELNTLLGKVKEVISENEHLHSAQQQKLLSRMFQTYQPGSETDDLEDQGDSTGLDSDYKTTPSKLRRSLSKSRGPKLEGSNIVFESRIAELEAQLTQAKIDLKKVQEENNDNKRKLASGLVDSTCLDGFKRQIDNLQRDKSALESQISKLKISLEQRPSDEGYKRGSDTIEQSLREERNNLEAELRRMKEDLAKERSRVRELCGENARRAVAERSAAEQRYNAHFDELSHDLAAQYDNVSKLQLELERQRRDENDLKREISMKNAVIEELKMELKNKSSSLQADLAQAHAEKASLDEELASARLVIERHQRQAKHETNRMNSEIQSLRQRLDRADADLVHSRRENLRLTEQIATLEKELNMKNLTPMSPEKNKKELEHAATVAQLEAMVQSQNSLMEKLTSDCRVLTDKLDDASRRHKEELATLHRQVDYLSHSMQQVSAHDNYYPAPATHAAPAHRPDDAEPPPSSPGPLYTKPDPPSHSQVRRQPSNTSIGHSRPQSRQLSRHSSKTSMRLDNQPEINQRYTEEVPERDLVNKSPQKVYSEPETAVDLKPNQGNEHPTRHEEDETNYAQEPTGYTQEPKGYTQEQTGYSQEPTGYTQEPTGYAQEPTGYAQEPTGYAQEPTGYTQEPTGYAQESTGYTQEPTGYTQEPTGYTQEPTGYAEESEEYSQEHQEPKYDQGQENYDQSYVDPNYQAQGYEQPTYAEQSYPQEQYQGNYTDQQYPENAQYKGQYENYATDPNYEKTQNYEQGLAANQVYTTQAPNVVPNTVKTTHKKDKIESRVTTSPVAKASTNKS